MPQPPDPARDDATVKLGQSQTPTADAPTMPQPAGGVIKLAGELLSRGDTIDDFEVLEILGRGAFGVVYRARQKSLDREVALKVAANRGSEGRTMARLEHRHIVQVFSETVHEPTNQRLLCMQLVSGVPLNVVIDELRHHKARGEQWTGADLLATLDRRSPLSPTLDPSALRDREQLATMDAVQATAWIGARLAEAVDYAHQQGVLHRDIKPANVLVNRYGQPMLADFNISFQSFDGETAAGENFGGTIAYMAPEHLAAFNPRDETTAELVDQRSDIYSLGLVVAQLLSTEFPLPLPAGKDASQLARVEQLARSRRAFRPTVRGGPCDARKAIDHVVARCTAAPPDERFARGSDMMAALDGVAALRAVERAPQSRNWWIELLQRRPFVCLIAAALVPQFIGSAFNIAYNNIEIVGRLTDQQEQVFWDLVFRYNAVVYPLAVVVGTWVLLRLASMWKRFNAHEPARDADAARARRATLAVPLWLMLLVALGWLPGGLLFPLIINDRAGPVPPSVFWHFIASFSLSGLIALAYSLCGVQYVALRGFYARMWPVATDFHRVARRELEGKAWRLTLVQLLARSIPLAAAVLLLAVQPTGPSRSFYVLVIGLILLGDIGSQLTSHLTRRIDDIAARMMG